MSTLQLTKTTLWQYMVPKYKVYLPSWEPMRRVAHNGNGRKRGCSSCKKGRALWREFLQWYEKNPKAITELKQLTSRDQIEFWNSLNHPPQRIVV